jgi:hypothetical protein
MMTDAVSLILGAIPTFSCVDSRKNTLNFSQPIFGQGSKLGPPYTVTPGILAETSVGVGGVGGNSD